MSEQMDDASSILARAKDTYQYKLGMVDKLLEAAVANDPSQLTAARAVQAGYTTGFVARRPMPGIQGPFTAIELTQLLDGPPSAALA